MKDLFESHGIRTQTLYGRLFVCEEGTKIVDGKMIPYSDWSDATDWTKEQSKIWLGY